MYNNSLTNTNFEKKWLVEVPWQVDANVGPVQFVVTVVQEPHAFWSHWQPATGLLTPAAGTGLAPNLDTLKKLPSVVPRIIDVTTVLPITESTAVHIEVTNPAAIQATAPSKPSEGGVLHLTPVSVCDLSFIIVCH